MDGSLEIALAGTCLSVEVPTPICVSDLRWSVLDALDIFGLAEHGSFDCRLLAKLPTGLVELVTDADVLGAMFELAASTPDGNPVLQARIPELEESWVCAEALESTLGVSLVTSLEIDTTTKVFARRMLALPGILCDSCDREARKALCKKLRHVWSSVIGELLSTFGAAPNGESEQAVAACLRASSLFPSCILVATQHAFQRMHCRAVENSVPTWTAKERADILLACCRTESHRVSLFCRKLQTQVDEVLQEIMRWRGQIRTNSSRRAMLDADWTSEPELVLCDVEFPLCPGEQITVPLHPRLHLRDLYRIVAQHHDIQEHFCLQLLVNEVSGEAVTLSLDNRVGECDRLLDLQRLSLPFRLGPLPTELSAMRRLYLDIVRVCGDSATSFQEHAEGAGATIGIGNSWILVPELLETAGVDVSCKIFVKHLGEVLQRDMLRHELLDFAEQLSSPSIGVFGADEDSIINPVSSTSDADRAEDHPSGLSLFVLRDRPELEATFRLQDLLTLSIGAVGALGNSQTTFLKAVSRTIIETRHMSLKDPKVWHAIGISAWNGVKDGLQSDAVVDGVINGAKVGTAVGATCDAVTICLGDPAAALGTYTAVGAVGGACVGACVPAVDGAAQGIREALKPEVLERQVVEQVKCVEYTSISWSPGYLMGSAVLQGLVDGGAKWLQHSTDLHSKAMQQEVLVASSVGAAKGLAKSSAIAMALRSISTKSLSNPVVTTWLSGAVVNLLELVFNLVEWRLGVVTGSEVANRSAAQLGMCAGGGIFFSTFNLLGAHAELARWSMAVGALCGACLASTVMAWCANFQARQESKRRSVGEASHKFGIPLSFSSGMLNARFRAISKFIHPDHCNGTTTSGAAFQEAHAAYALLHAENIRRRRMSVMSHWLLPSMRWLGFLPQSNAFAIEL